MLSVFLILFVFLFYLIFNYSLCLSVSFLFVIFFFSLFSFKMEFSFWSFCSLIFSGNNFNVVMVLLSVWISVLMVLVSMKYQFLNIMYGMFNFVIGFLLMVVVMFFLVDNLLVLYIFFELSLLPTLYLILKWGYQPERLQSGFYFVMYTICGSLPLLYMICKINKDLFSFSMITINPMALVCGTSLTYYLFYISFILAFLIKMPMWGVHLWLPKAHVEAPVSGSMILAGILLKLGGYGLIQIFNMIYKINFSSVLYFLISVNLWGALVVGLVCLSCVDIKMLIAYSSVVHMNMVVVSIFSNSYLGYLGALLMMVAHGVSSPGMFAMANINYESVQSRNLLLYKGLGFLQPSINIFWFFLIAANMAAPPSLNLISEVFICVSILKLSFLFCFICGVLVFISGAYNVYLYSSQQGNFVYFLCPIYNSLSVTFYIGLLHLFPMLLFVWSINLFVGFN